MIHLKVNNLHKSFGGNQVLKGRELSKSTVPN